MPVLEQPTFFDSPAHFRRWPEANHASADVLWLGFFKVKSGKKGITYEEAVEEALRKAGRMAAPGLAIFEARDPKRAGLYSFENRGTTLGPAFTKRFRAKARAWKFFEAQPPGYRRLAVFWVMKAKREETRERRFNTLLEDSARGVRVGAVVGPARQKGR